MNKTILIIDDDNMLRNTLAKGLRNDGFDAITAASGEEGADILSRIKVDAIVLDRMMGGIDGLTMLKNLRGAGNTTPVLMLTAMTGPENSIDGLLGGANDYLAKPFQLRELILRLGNIIKSTDAAPGGLPDGLMFVDDEFFADGKLLGLSGEEKKLLQLLVTPMGNVAPASPMVAKRLRVKLNGVILGMDMITMRGRGYKLVRIQQGEQSCD